MAVVEVTLVLKFDDHDGQAPPPVEDTIRMGLEEEWDCDVIAYSEDWYE